ncbi:MAG: MATE family efflux transporter [Epulopiscium sp.]|nr:MATE family efflux transporter [Candidatus Epulonipiscium sp.]
MERQRRLIKLAGPIFVELLLSMLLGIIDIFMLSQYDDRAAGAVGASNQIINNLNLIFAIISAGTAVLVAQNVGANKKEEIEKVSAVSLIMNFIIGMIISAGMIVFGKPILRGIGVTPDLMNYAYEYTLIVGGALFVQAILNTLLAIIRSHGYTKQSMYISGVMNIVNIVGDAVFVFGLFGAPVLGVKGVALATTFSKMCAVVAAFAFLVRSILSVKMFIHIKETSMYILKELFKIGFPAAMENMSYSLSQTVLMSIILIDLGDTAYITRTYVWQISWIASIFVIAIGQANQIIIGQLVGGGEIEEAYEAGISNLKIAMFFSIVGALILFFFGEALTGIFSKNPAIIVLGGATLVVDAFLEPGRVFNVVLINGLRGAGDVIFPVVMAMISMWSFGVAGGYIFSVVLGLGLPGIWMGMVIDEWFRGICMLFRWKNRKWTQRWLVEQECIS